MKNTLILLVGLLATTAFTLVKAQNPVIKFKDGSTYAVKGSFVGQVIELSDGKESKVEKTYYQRKGDVITLTKVTDWIQQKTMDELRVYSFSKSLINPSISLDMEESDDEGLAGGKYFGVNFAAIDEKEFEFDVYSIWEGKPTKRSFSVFDIKCDKKELLEKMVEDIKSVLPKQEE